MSLLPELLQSDRQCLFTLPPDCQLIAARSAATQQTICTPQLTQLAALMSLQPVGSRAVRCVTGGDRHSPHETTPHRQLMVHQTVRRHIIHLHNLSLTFVGQIT